MIPVALSIREALVIREEMERRWRALRAAQLQGLRGILGPDVGQDAMWPMELMEHEVGGPPFVVVL